jgi:hypothetical protein
MDELAGPGVKIHYTGPLEQAALAYDRAPQLGLFPHGPRTHAGIGTFTAVLAHFCRWDQLIGIVEDLAATEAPGGNPAAATDQEPSWTAT